VYIDNHDGMSGKFNYHTAQLYGQGILFMLAHPYGAAAQIMSSFYYPDVAEATKSSPPLVPMTSEEKQKSSTDYRVNLTRKVDAAFGRCRITPHDAVPYTEPDAAWLNGTCENGGTGCNWICQHRWTGVAGLTHVRKLIPKDVSMERIWIAAPGRFSFSIGDRAWVFLQQYLNPKGDLKELMISGPTTGLPAGEYCNVAQLPSAYAESLSHWFGSDGQKYCSDSKNEMVVKLDEGGFVISGVAPAGTMNGMVVIHKDFPAQSNSAIVLA
jgi:hypothetical protein